ncbi:MAG TPA: YdeI/OmpD-associated family protein [Opitutaceae bacterium]|nr:YdeI/OmpD-associated family protein [Opitutaceae bacterium]
MPVVHFENGAAFRAWLEKNHAAAAELQVGFYKKGSGKGGMTYFEAVEEALCFGWIDGTIRRLDEERYTHRFTPRRKKSVWSLVNVARAKALLQAGRMRAAGIAAFEARKAARTGVYGYEQGPRKDPVLPRALERIFRADRGAWEKWRALPPGYRRTATRWVLCAKREATRRRRLGQLMRLTRAGRRLGLTGGA